ncbi:MAG: hypothetical protein ACRCZ9_08950 [Fusobacteriaceae bacterium]
MDKKKGIILTIDTVSQDSIFLTEEEYKSLTTKIDIENHESISSIWNKVRLYSTHKSDDLIIFGDDDRYIGGVDGMQSFSVETVDSISEVEYNLDNSVGRINLTANSATPIKICSDDQTDDGIFLIERKVQDIKYKVYPVSEDIGDVRRALKDYVHDGKVDGSKFRLQKIQTINIPEMGYVGVREMENGNLVGALTVNGELNNVIDFEQPYDNYGTFDVDWDDNI